MIQKAKELLKEAKYLLITAGAGMGVDSGLPDFRGKEGFWRAYPIAKRLNLNFYELANPKWFIENPKLAWGFYGHRLNLYRNTTPHSGFFKLLEFAKSKKDYFVFTSNVDGQFQKAGFSEDKIDEIHGSIHRLQCTKPCCSDVWDAKSVNLEIDLNTLLAKEPLPRCIHCNDLARPNILMFSDSNFVSSKEEEQRRNLAKFINSIDGKLVILEFGAGLAVPTVRNFSEIMAQDLNATLIRVNPRDYQAPKDAISLQMGAKEAIDILI